MDEIHRGTRGQAEVNERAPDPADKANGPSLLAVGRTVLERIVADRLTSSNICAMLEITQHPELTTVFDTCTAWGARNLNVLW